MKNIILDNLQIIKKWNLKNEVDLQKISKKIKEQEQKIKDLKFNKYQKKDIKIEPRKEKDDLNLSPNIGLDNDYFSEKREKAEKIATDIENVKNESEKVDIKIDNLSNDNLIQTQKDKLFVELEKDILNLKIAVEKLKDENQNLKKELELIIEKIKIESQKSGLEKENSSLKDKLEALKDKTRNLKNEFESDSKNKITYKDKPESQAIKDYENLNDNQKER